MLCLILLYTLSVPVAASDNEKQANSQTEELRSQLQDLHAGFDELKADVLVTKQAQSANRSSDDALDERINGLNSRLAKIEETVGKLTSVVSVTYFPPSLVGVKNFVTAEMQRKCNQVNRPSAAAVRYLSLPDGRLRVTEFTCVLPAPF